MWVSRCMAHIRVALGLRLWVPYLSGPHSNMSHIMRWILSWRVGHVLWRVVLVHACCIRCGCALHSTIVSLRHLVCAHLVGSTTSLGWSRWVT